MFGVPLLGWVAPRLGIHLLMSGMGLMVAVSCFIHPLTVSWSFPVFVGLRFISGTVLAVLFATAGDVIAKWAPLDERGIWAQMLSRNGHPPLMGAGVSWPAIYYSHGGLALIVTILWIVLHKNDPRKVTWLKQGELDQILEGKQEMLVKKAKKRALHFPLSTCGLVVMIPLLLLLLIKVATGQLSGMLHSIREVTRMRIFNSIALFGSAVFFILASFWEPNGSWGDVTVVVLPVCILGCHSGGYPECVVVVAKQHSPAVFAYMQTKTRQHAWTKSEVETAYRKLLPKSRVVKLLKLGLR
ncbi:unnamed protein product, partial [Mesorhabditis spiculigera]